MQYLALILTILLVSIGFPPADGENNFQDFLVSDLCSQEPVMHNVSWGEYLGNIGQQYGSVFFWEAIYIYNAHQVTNPNFIFEGQKLLIPNRIAYFKSSDEELENVINDPFCAQANIPFSDVDTSYLTLYDTTRLQDFEKSADSTKSLATIKTDTTQTDSVMAAFREAFESVVQEHQPADDDTVSQNETAQRNSERQLMLEIDGMVHDETRSKAGRDFYDVFYTYWQNPPEASNFSIRIYEQPSPSLGTIIYVQVNDVETFRMRLQPRYDIIEEAAQFAVRQTYRQLQSGLSEIQIY